MRSVRIGEALERQLAAAARKAGVSASEFVRQAVREYCEKIRAGGLDPRWAEFVGAVSSRTGSSRNLGRQYADSLLREHEANRAKRRRRRSA